MYQSTYTATLLPIVSFSQRTHLVNEGRHAGVVPVHDDIALSSSQLALQPRDDVTAGVRRRLRVD